MSVRTNHERQHRCARVDDGTLALTAVDCSLASALGENSRSVD